MKKKIMILMTLSAILVATAIAQVTSGNHLITSRNEVTPTKAVTARVERVNESESPPAHNNPTTAAGQNESQDSVEVEVVMATPDGFEPAVVTRPHGPFILAVHNRSGARELVLRLLSLQDGQISETRLRPGGRRQHQRLNLPPGEYTLSEASHSEWHCQILVTR
jgi:hypothetical protein